MKVYEADRFFEMAGAIESAQYEITRWLSIEHEREALLPDAAFPKSILKVIDAIQSDAESLDMKLVAIYCADRIQFTFDHARKKNEIIDFVELQKNFKELGGRVRDTLRIRQFLVIYEKESD